MVSARKGWFGLTGGKFIDCRGTHLGGLLHSRLQRLVAMVASAAPLYGGVGIDQKWGVTGNDTMFTCAAAYPHLLKIAA